LACHHEVAAATEGSAFLSDHRKSRFLAPKSGARNDKQ